MIPVELKTVEEYYEKGAWEDDVFLKILENKYPVLYQKTFELLQNTCRLNGDNSVYTEEELKEIFFIDEIIETFEELYDDGTDGEIIILNYFVRDENHTDRGIEYLTLVDGYVLVEGENE